MLLTRNLLHCALLAPLLAGAAAPSDLAQLDFFEKKIRPVLAESCYECHSAGAKKIRGGLLLDTRDGLLKGGDSGTALIPGNPKKSLLLVAMRHDDKDIAMPPKKDKLPATVLSDFEQWVQMGAPDPRTGPSKATAWDPDKAAQHWAFKPVSKPAVPAPADPAHFVQNPIDAFVLEALQKNKLQPSPKADKAALVRRVTYDLTGLPPSSQDVEDFVGDTSPAAYEKLVDRLLASPRYGERWARHWLDIARYADTSGDRNNTQKGQIPALYSYAWTYRDYVIKAFNDDLPYDRFLLEQIAADHLPETAQHKHTLAALGFLTVGKQFMRNANDVIDDRIDVVTKGLMGLTGACARCHDHKFDPVPTKDYYALHGVFASSDESFPGPQISEPRDPAAHAAFLEAEKKIEEELKTFSNDEATRLTAGMTEHMGDYLLLLEETKGTEPALKRDTKMRKLAFERGRSALVAAALLGQMNKSRTLKKDPLLGPWITLAEVSKDQFAEKLPALLEELRNTPELNPSLVTAITEKNAASMEDIAAVYNTFFAQLHTALQLPSFPTGRKDQKVPAAMKIDKARTELADTSMESLRQAVFGSTSCMMPDERVTRGVLGANFTNRQATINNKYSQLYLAHPGSPVRAKALEDKPRPVNSPVFIRGEAGNKGPVVPRHFLTVLGGSEQKPFTQGSGRLELAKSIASKDNPLTARVIANRIWQWHFGQGIVRTVSDFGTRSEPPTHPELLNWLASSLMENGWSLKALHKLVVLSATYQQDSKPHNQGMTTDPTNQFLWRANIQRLDFEQLRDSLLAFSGKLDTYDAGGPPFALSNAATPAKGRYASMDATTLKSNTNRRTIYAMVDRAAMPEMFNTFDFANPDISTGERVLTTVPQQSLFMMNSPFVAEQVRAILKRSDFPAAASDEKKIQHLFHLIFQRAPRPAELDAARAFLASDSPQPVQESGPAADASKQAKAAAPAQTLSLWERYTQVLLLTNEVLYVE